MDADGRTYISLPVFTPTYLTRHMSLSFTSLQNHHGAADYSRSSGTRRFSWGIFEVVYDHPTRTFTPLRGLLIYKNFQSTTRFFRELSTIAPAAFAIHVLGCIWMSVSPALSLYLSYVILEMISVSIFLHRYRSSFTSIIQIQTSPNARQVSHCDELVLQVYAALWLSSAAVSTLVDRIM